MQIFENEIIYSQNKSLLFTITILKYSSMPFLWYMALIPNRKKMTDETPVVAEDTTTEAADTTEATPEVATDAPAAE